MSLGHKGGFHPAKGISSVSGLRVIRDLSVQETTVTCISVHDKVSLNGPMPILLGRDSISGALADRRDRKITLMTGPFRMRLRV